MRKTVVPALLVPAVLFLSPCLAQSPDATAAQIQRAAEAYERGDCSGVLTAFGALADPERDLALDGLSQYRWGFCLGLLGRGEPAPRYRLAAELLGQEVQAPTARLEAFFYGTNALLNLSRRDEALATAKEAIARWKAGALTIPAETPTAWFQLGKLFADGGDFKGALEHYGRAVQLAGAGPRPLRGAYLERIADFAAEHGDWPLAEGATRLLAASDPDSLSTALRTGRLLLARGDIAGAREEFRKGMQIPGEAAGEAQYIAAALDRVLEVADWGGQPVQTAPDGRALTQLSIDEVRAQLKEAAGLGFQAMRSGRVVETPRPKGPGTRPAPHPDALGPMRDAQNRFAGLLVEAVKRKAPLQEWAVIDGYPLLVHNKWTQVFLQLNAKDRSEQVIELKPER